MLREIDLQRLNDQAMNMPELQNSLTAPTVISARRLILIIGLLGFILPLLLIAITLSIDSCMVLHDSISAYYFTKSRNIFVGTLCALSLCLLVYQGYSKSDNILSSTGSIFALGVAFFPTSVSGNGCITAVKDSLNSSIHFISAGLLFTVFAIFSLFLFTRSNKLHTQAKDRENLIYRACGIIIVICIALIACWFLVEDNDNYNSLKSLKPVFWLESVALWSFSASWLTKSKIFSSEQPV